MEESYRGGGERGVWPRMLEALETRLKAQGIKQLRLDCYIDNPAAVRAYTKQSFRPVQVSVCLFLRGDTLWDWGVLGH